MESIRGGVGTDGKSSCDLGSIPEDLETLKPHPSLTQALEALQPMQHTEGDIAINPQLLKDNIEIRLERMEEAILAVDNDSEDSDQDSVPSGDDDSIASFDSIARNADFISLGN